MHLLSKLALLCLLIYTQLSLAEPKGLLLEKLNQIGNVQAEFVQRTSDRDGNVINVSKGTLTASEGGKFRIENTEPFPQQLVSNGDDFYSYDPELEQVILRYLVKDVSQVPILILGSSDPNLLNDFEISQSSEQSFLLSAVNNSVFEQLEITFQTAETFAAQPAAIWFRDSLGQTTEINLSQVRLNQPLAPNLFEFEVPDGVDLIDDR